MLLGGMEKRTPTDDRVYLVEEQLKYHLLECVESFVSTNDYEVVVFDVVDVDDDPGKALSGIKNS